jgi:hypothetical protein
MFSVVATPLSYPVLVHYLIEQDKWRLLWVYGVDITHQPLPLLLDLDDRELS